MTITENGVYTAPEGTAYSPVNVNVPSKEEETKSITITENGTTTVLPTSGKVLSKVDIVANVPQTAESGTVKNLLDHTKMARTLFYNYSGTSVDDLISYDDTSNVTNMGGIFSNCKKLTTIPLLNTSSCTNLSSAFEHCENITTIPQLDTSKVTNMYYIFVGCFKLNSIPQLDTSKVTDMGSMFASCFKLKTVTSLDMNNVTNVSSMFYSCSNLTYLKLLNVKVNLQIGSSNEWGHLIEKDCLIQIISELIKPSSGTRTLTMGTANKAKIADTYVKLLEDDGTGKYPFEVCASTDEGAMTIEAYCTYKSWQIA